MAYSEFSVILVAAGMSERMGTQNKLLIDVENVPMIRKVASIYLTLGMPLTIVLGHQSDEIREALVGLDVDFVHNPEYQAGQQSSVRAGLEAIETPERAILIALADQPFLTSGDITTYCDSFKKDGGRKITVPYFGEDRGNPVLIPASFLNHIRENAQDQSLREFIDDNPHIVSKYRAPNDHFTTDIDTMDDVTRLLPDHR